MEFIEPDFKFIFVPKRDLRNDPRYACIKEGYEIADIYMEIKKKEILIERCASNIWGICNLWHFFLGFREWKMLITYTLL